MKKSCIILLFLISACAAGEDYAKPESALPEWWPSFLGGEKQQVMAKAEGEAEASRKWWEAFNDPVLSALVAKAEANNRDVKAAAARVREARAARIVTGSALLPQVDAKVDAMRGNEQNVYNNKALTLYDAKFDASWELDLFGGVRRKEEAAEAEIEAREAAERGALLTLRAEMVRGYIDIRRLERVLAIAQESAKTNADTLQLTRSLDEAGLGDASATAQAQAEASGADARTPQISAALAQAKNQLAVLLGVAPGDVAPLLGAEEASAIPLASETAVVDAPVSVIARRPDVAQAERELASATALKSSAIADMYPKISIGGVLGVQHSSFVDEVNPAWNLGAGLLQPIFKAGQLEAQAEAADARKEQALHAYEQVVLKALADVDSALASTLLESQRQESLLQAAEASANAAQLARERYEAGLSSYLEVLTAERARFEADTALTDSQAQTAVNFVALNKALGW